MQDRAADSVAPSPRLLWRGEGGGEGLAAPIVVFAPHPTPLPVKNGEREQTDRASAGNSRVAYSLLIRDALCNDGPSACRTAIVAPPAPSPTRAAPHGTARCLWGGRDSGC